MARSNLDLILAELQQSESNITHFDEGWSQGRSAFGGLSTAFAVTAMNKRVDSDMPLRSLMVSFIAPIPPGEIKVETHIQRQGKNVTQLSADIWSGGECCLQAMGVYGRARASINVNPTREFQPMPRESGIPFSENTHLAPAFVGYFDGGWAGGGIPFSGSENHKLGLWAKHQIDMNAFPAESLVTIADIPPPVLLSRFKKPPVPSSSLTWSLEFIKPPGEFTIDWFYLEMEMEAAADGYTQQSGLIYSEDGTLCALSRQCMVYFGPAPTGS
ncbi:MAG: thioesterase family protein [Gammaproteobacteria bacterium]|nr:thioesterase family protein [Gammaproteobacteria bacterium]